MNVIYIIFNRPELTKESFAAIRVAAPKKLFVIADGPRQNNLSDIENCKRARSIVEAVDWDCEVYRDFSEINLGCGKRVSSGITNAFKLVEEAIILEDDCIPSLDFFGYCHALLDKYRHDYRVMSITGNCFQPPGRTSQYSYYFSKYAHIWGWATWRRAWNHYDFELKVLRESGRDFMQHLCQSESEANFWYRAFESIARGDLDNWDVQWVLAHWMNSGLVATPVRNLVRNIGFGPDATHTKSKDSFLADLVANELGPIQHPPHMFLDYQADEYVRNRIFEGTSGGDARQVTPLTQRVFNRLSKIFAVR